MTAIEPFLVVGSLLLLAGVLASKASSRSGVPSLILFLSIGMLAGSEGPGGIPFDDYVLAQTLGVVALALILFFGGLETDWSTTSSVLWRGLSLSTLGVVLTALTVGWFASLVLKVSFLEGLLLGAIVSSTDAAAVFSVLRTRGASLKGRLKPLLEFESGSNDPMAVFLTVGVIQLLQDPSSSVWSLAGGFVVQMALGAGLGYAGGRFAVWLINRIRLETEGLYPVLTLALALLVYGLTAVLGGNGFLAVYLAGIVLGNQDFIHKRSLIRFHDAVAWLMQILMFLTLGLLVFPSHLLPVAGSALLISAFLMFVARPIGVFLGLAASGVRRRQLLMISWVGLRGAVPIILGTYPLLYGIERAETIFNIVFFIVLTSVLLQGTTLTAVAGWLGVRAPLTAKRRYPFEIVPTQKTESEFVELTASSGSPAIGKQIVDLHLPKSVLIVLLTRGETYLTPRGATVLQEGDDLLILSDRPSIPMLRELFDPSDSAEDQGGP
jgi:cell volume regulation protein A